MWQRHSLRLERLVGGGGERAIESSILNISLKTWEASEWLPSDAQLTAQDRSEVEIKITGLVRK